MAPHGQIVKAFSIVGSTVGPRMIADGASLLIQKLRALQGLLLEREPTNPHDTNAVMVLMPLGGGAPAKALGYLPRGLAATVAPLMDQGQRVVARKAANALYGVCEIAYIPELAVPASAVSVTDRDIAAGVTGTMHLIDKGDATEKASHEILPADHPANTGKSNA